MKKIKNYISGSEYGSSINYLPVEDPSTGEQIAKVIISNQRQEMFLALPHT